MRRRLTPSGPALELQRDSLTDMVSRKDDLSSVKKYPLVRRLNSAPKK